MRTTCTSTRTAWVLGLSLALCPTFVGCGEESKSTAQPQTQTEEQKAKQAAADKATADAFKDVEKNKQPGGPILHR